MRYPFGIDIYGKGHCSEHIEGTFGTVDHFMCFFVILLFEYHKVSLSSLETTIYSGPQTTF